MLAKSRLHSFHGYFKYLHNANYEHATDLNCPRYAQPELHNGFKRHKEDYEIGDDAWYLQAIVVGVRIDAVPRNLWIP